MPIIVDHAQRRCEVLEIAIDLIAEGGVDRASVRSIAERARCSTAIVSHYFHNKAELLELAFERTIEQTRQRVDKAIVSECSTLRALEVLLPLNLDAARSWKIWFAFWGMALSDLKYRRIQATHGREGQEIIRRLLDVCGDVPKAAAGGRDAQAGRLLPMIAGIAALATYDPEGWPPKRQRAILAAELEALTNG